jgi:hypothetical protein
LVAHYQPADPPADVDGDGLPDAWEQAHGLNPAKPADALEDPDADGLNNREEWQAGTDPHDPRSRLQLFVRRDGSRLDLTWEAMANRRYVLEESPTFDPPAWVEVQTVPAGPLNRLASITVNVGQNSVFYRLRATATP